MPLYTTQKQELINSHQAHGTDTGSVEVQVAMLSERIQQLTVTCRRTSTTSPPPGLLKMIGRRKRLLGYLRAQSETRYAELIKKLGIRG